MRSSCTLAEFHVMIVMVVIVMIVIEDSDEDSDDFDGDVDYGDFRDCGHYPNPGFFFDPKDYADFW